MTAQAENDALRSNVRAAISNAYYDARNSGRTMEQAADDAADRVMEALRTADSRCTIPYPHGRHTSRRPSSIVECPGTYVIPPGKG